jgi:DNA sulfur modification protein DndB
MVHLACLRGNIGYWTYYSTVIKIKDLVTDNRVITVSESEELYTQNINRILQREINQSRIKSLKKYIKENDERFFSSLIVAVHKGSPKWSDIDLFERIEIDGSEIEQEQVNFLGSKFGILSLNGDEEIFALDGQHRLKGLRKAYEEDETIANLEIPVIFVIHNHSQVDKTRRLFTVLNKYAEKPKGAELIILDEDDVAAINTRRLVIEHPILSKPNALSSAKSGAIPTNDNKSFTTLVTLYNINKKLYSQNASYYTVRPDDTVIENLYQKSVVFWNTLFEIFPELINYIDELEDLTINDKPILRNDDSGGTLLLRPVGQELIANAYTKFSTAELSEFKRKLRLIDFNLSGNIWKYIFWNEKMLGKEAKLKNNLLLFLLGKNTNEDEVHESMRRVYNTNGQEYENHVHPIL